MKRFNTICNLGDQSLIDYDIPDVEFGESITDDSFFVPTAEALKTASGVLSEDEVRQYYDFPDGKDTGVAPPLARKKGVDIAELSTDVRHQQDEIVSVVNKAKKEAEFKKDLKKRYGNPVEKAAEQSVVE